MNTPALKAALKTVLEGELPGLPAQMTMAPMKRATNGKAFSVPDDAKKAAVLVLFYPGPDGVYLPLMLRNDYKGVHSNQVSFPGGTWEEKDGDLLTTALREAEEEVGVAPSEIEVMGPLSQMYIPPSNFLVQPYMAVAEKEPDFVPDPTEVNELIRARLADFVDPRYVGTSKIKHRTGSEWEVPSYTINGHVIWGATAMMMAEVMAVVERAGVLRSAF
ncbi:MAG: CoA pyrophosphatase [Bacteroidota bacterium]